VIVGVGNVLLKDEGIGVHVVRALQEMSLASPNGEVEVVDGGTSPSALDSAEGADKLIIVDAARGGRLPFAHLVADDRVTLEATHGRLVASAPEAIRGLIEVRGLGIRRIEHEPRAVVGLVVDLASQDAARLPAPVAATCEILGVRLPRLPVASEDPLPIVLACISTAPHT